MAATASEKRRDLTLRERMFASLLFSNGLNATRAYADMMDKLGKPCTVSTAESQGPRMRARICRTSEFRAILEARGLDEITLADDLNRLRTIKRPAFSRDGYVIGEYDDGQVQLGAAKMLGESLDALKPAVLNVAGVISIGEPPKPADLPAEEVADV